MKIINLDEMLLKACLEKENIVISIRSWDFLKDWEPAIFDGLEDSHLMTFDVGEDRSVDFFELKTIHDDQQIERLIRYPTVKLIANDPYKDFCHQLPESFLKKIREFDEFDENDLREPLKTS